MRINKDELKASFNLFSEIAYGILFSPRATFVRLIGEPANDRLYLVGAALTVLLVSLIDGFNTPSAVNSKWIMLSLTLACVIGLARWLSLSLLVALTVTIFGAHSSRIFPCLATTGWAFLPLILLAPLSCYKLLLGPFYVLFVIALYLWVIALEWLAVQETYKLKGIEMYCLVFAVPSLLLVVQLLWISPIVLEFLKAYITS